MNTDKHILQPVRQFREAVGLPVDSGDKCNVTTHRAVIKEEILEAVDGMTDTLVTLAGWYHDSDGHDAEKALRAIERTLGAMKAFGLDPAECMAIVHEANMSKLCKADDIKPTETKYELDDVEFYVKELPDNLFAFYSAKCQVDKHGKFYPKDKLLKAHNWHEPYWSNMRDWAGSEICDLLDE